jgi:hypothetical protein
MNIDAGAVNAIAELERNSHEGERFELDGVTWLYTDRDARVIQWDPQPLNINVSSLRSLVDLIDQAPPFEPEQLLAIVRDELNVTILGPESKKTRQRPIVATAQLTVGSFRFDAFMDQETFLINLYALFDRQAGDFAEVVSYASSVVNVESLKQKDDGISQTASVKRGVHSEEELAKAPSIVNLRPFRTFREIAQPMSTFVFRIRNAREGIEFALFEADGAVWRLGAMEAIKEYLRKGLPQDVLVA